MVSVGDRAIAVVTRTLSASPGATAHQACYLDEAEMASVCLDIWDVQADDYDALQAAADLVANLAA